MTGQSPAPFSPSRSQTLPPRSNVARRIAELRREDQELGSKLTSVAFVRVVAVSLSLAGVIAYAPSGAGVASWQYVLIAVTYALSATTAFLLRYRRYLMPLAYSQIVIDTVVVSILVIMTGVIESPFTFVYVFTVLAASVTLYRRGALIATICYFLMFGTLALLQVEELLRGVPPVVFGRAMFSFTMHSAGIAMIGVLSSTLAEKLKTTGRELAEKRIDYERLEELHAAILRSLPAGLMTIDGEGGIRYANEAALGILRRESGEVIGARLDEIAPAIAERWTPTLLNVDKATPRERFEASHQRSDGRTIRIGFSFAPLGGDEVGTWGSIAVFQDVTHIVRLKDAYERAERLATVGKMAAGLAHEVRNPLASVCASIDVLKESLNPPEPMQRLMNNVVREADRLNTLITDFLEFARPREPNLQQTDVSALIASVFDVLRNDALLAGVKLELEVQPSLFARVDPGQLRQVVWNLGRNGAEAIQSSQKRRLAVSARSRGEIVELVFRDSGPGIPADKMKRIFDPFFTTKERGTGLGLAITHSIVAAHGGSILVESNHDEGTEVIVSLPVLGPVLIEEPSSDMDILGGSLEPPRTDGAIDGSGSRRR
jgi:two-component system sensor histidine kinase PilS (NtrC family)